MSKHGVLKTIGDLLVGCHQPRHRLLQQHGPVLGFLVPGVDRRDDLANFWKFTASTITVDLALRDAVPGGCYLSLADS